MLRFAQPIFHFSPVRYDIGNLFSTLPRPLQSFTFAVLRFNILPFCGSQLSGSGLVFSHLLRLDLQRLQLFVQMAALQADGLGGLTDIAAIFP